MPVAFVEEAEGFDDEGVFPDNQQAVSLFCDLLTQWRVGPSGIVGLDYGALPAVMSFRRVRAADREEIFDAIRIMESAALSDMRSSDAEG